MSSLILHICYNLLYDKKSRNRHRQLATIPFTITFDMPELEKKNPWLPSRIYKRATKYS